MKITKIKTKNNNSFNTNKKNKTLIKELKFQNLQFQGLKIE